MERWQITHGRCQEILATYPDNHFSAVITDPPYGLKFMGKAWDAQVPDVETWQAVLRVLKPGGHLLCFAGTRTHHRMAVNIEDAGFEIRDMIAWVYGSGFPKSHNISKAIDKTNGEMNRALRFTAWCRSTGVTARQIDTATGSHMGGHYVTDQSQPAIPTRAMFEKMRGLFVSVPQEIEDLIDRIEAPRDVVAKQQRHFDTTLFSGLAKSWDVTADATALAKQWSGWGTALKPALEPITVARKPFASTVAANVVEHGTGGLNIDATRIAHGEDVNLDARQNCQTAQSGSTVTLNIPGHSQPTYAPGGRWPANLIHDGSEDVSTLLADAARFFYCAKVSKRERTANGQVENKHPTVKPIALMRYLIKLVTPPGGVIVDPFCGSGSTLLAAVAEGVNAVGIDADESSVTIARERLAVALEALEG